MKAGLILGGLRLRRHRRTTVALVLMTAVGVGVVLAALAGARRTDAALPAMLRHERAGDAYVFFAAPATGTGTSPDLAPELAQVRALPGVRQARRFSNAVISADDSHVRFGHRRLLAWIGIDEGGLAMVGHPYVLAGRLPNDDAADELAIDEELARDAHLHVGSTYRFRAYAADQIAEVASPLSPPKGITVVGRVTGIVRHVYDLRDLQSPKNSNNIYLGHYDAYLTPGLWRAARGDIFGYNPTIGVTLARGQAGVPDLGKAVQAGVPNGLGVGTRQELFENSGTLLGVDRAVSLQSRSLQAFALVAALVALFLIGQTLARQFRIEASDDPVMRAMGATPRQLRFAALVRGTAVTMVGTALGIGVAVALSPLTPLPGSTARRALQQTGLAADWFIFGVGAACAWLLGAGLALVCAVRAERRRSYPASPPVAGRLADRLAALGAPPATTIGVRFALEPGRGRSAVPVRAALVTSAAAVLLVTGTGVFAASLHRLQHDPRLYGVTWDASVGGAATPEEAIANAEILRRDRDVRQFTGVNSNGVELGGRYVSALFLRADHGRVGPRVIDGRLPARDNEIALGSDTMRQLHAHVGGSVRVAGQGNPSHRFEVVGRVVLNPLGLDSTITPGKGAVVDWSAITVLTPTDVDTVAPQSFLLKFAPRADRAALLATLDRQFPGTTSPAFEPLDLQNLGDVASLPSLLAAVIALLGVATIVHALVSAVQRRGQDIATLKTLGFGSRQVRGVVTTQALTFAVVALVVGLPLGLALGRTAWTVAATQLSVIRQPAVPGGVLTLGALAFVLGAALVALVPGELARRVSVATALRRD